MPPSIYDVSGGYHEMFARLLSLCTNPPLYALPNAPPFITHAFRSHTRRRINVAGRDKSELELKFTSKAFRLKASDQIALRPWLEVGLRLGRGVGGAFGHCP